MGDDRAGGDRERVCVLRETVCEKETARERVCVCEREREMQTIWLMPDQAQPAPLKHILGRRVFRGKIFWSESTGLPQTSSWSGSKGGSGQGKWGEESNPGGGEDESSPLSATLAADISEPVRPYI